MSAATICAWDQGKGARPLHYPGREVTIDEFNLAAALDLRIKGHKEGVQNRVSAALARGSRK